PRAPGADRAEGIPFHRGRQRRGPRDRRPDAIVVRAIGPSEEPPAMRLPRLAPPVERPRPGSSQAAPARAEMRPQSLVELIVLKKTLCGGDCGPGGRCPAGCTCSGGKCV